MRPMFSLFSLSFIAIATVAGCAVSSENPSSEDTAATQEDITAANKLVGAYTASTGSLRGLVLGVRGNQRYFSAEEQVYCVRAPCYPIRWQGIWTASATKLTLTEKGPTNHVYTYTLVGGKLSLKDTYGIKYVLNKVPKGQTFCAASEDCNMQSWIHPMCAGVELCSADQHCAMKCGPNQRIVGYGDACGGSIGYACADGLDCVGMPDPSSGIIGGTGTCRPSTKVRCDLNVEKSCGDTLRCVVDTDGKGTCLPFAHAQTVGRGYSCGGSIGVGCAKGLDCTGLPLPPMVGGTGICE